MIKTPLLSGIIHFYPAELSASLSIASAAQGIPAQS